MGLGHYAFIFFLLLQPKFWNVVFVALTNSALIGIAHPLLGPEWALFLNVYFKSGEVGFALSKRSE
jgi:hypothetical protein